MPPVGLERASRVVGYDLTGADFSNTSPNLPQKIIILGEANHANQGSLVTAKTAVNSQKKAGSLFGYGSPIHMAMRILKPLYSDGVGGIPIEVIAQPAAVGAQSRIVNITPVGTAARSGTHYVKIAGRNDIDGLAYAVNIVAGDTVATIADKIENAVNAVLASPMSAISTSYLATLETKWRGVSAQGITVSMDTGDDTLGLTYTVTQTQAATGQPSITTDLDKIGNEWSTLVLNTYGGVSSILTALEAFNGKPAEDSIAPTGRYVGTTWKPFVAIFGSVLDDPSSLTDSRKAEVTNVCAPAPLSLGHPLEAAANALALYAVIAQNTPELDLGGLSYPDMPTPESIGSMASYDNRDVIMKKGCSTVNLVAGKYQVQDFVTTYHPDGDAEPSFRFVRNLVGVDFNYRYGVLLLEQQYVVDKVIVGDNDTVTSDNVIKPKDWKQILFDHNTDMGERALIVDVPFAKSNISVSISSSNPNRLETSLKYKRSGLARISSTQAQAGFNYGTV